MDNSPRIFLLEGQSSLKPNKKKEILDMAEKHANLAAESLEITWPVNITIYPNAEWTVPETSAGGYTPSKDWSQIYLDLTGKKIKLDQVSTERMVVTIYHEMNHLKRWHTTGYGNDLESTFVSEGLAGVFERTMFPSYTVPWLCYTQKEVDTLLNIVRKFNKEKTRSYIHSDWFFGANANIPKWLGYTVGHYIVSQAIERNPFLGLIDLMGKPAKEIIELSSKKL